MQKDSLVSKSLASLDHEPHNSSFKIPRSVSPLVSALMSTHKAQFSRPISHAETEIIRNPSHHATNYEFTLSRPTSALGDYVKTSSSRYETELQETFNRCSNKKLESEFRMDQELAEKNLKKSRLSEKHLKKYENLLAVKENRLREKEIMLKNQVLALEEEKGRLEREMNELKKEIEIKDQLIYKMKLRFSTQNVKNSLAKSWDFLGKINGEPEKEERFNELEQESETESNQLHNMLKKIQDKEAKLKHREEEITQKALELTLVVEKSEKKLREKWSSLKSFENQLKEERLNLDEGRYLRYPDEIEEMKAALEFQKECLENENKYLQESYSNKCEEIERLRVALFQQSSILNSSRFGNIALITSCLRDQSPNKSYSEEYDEIRRMKHLEISYIKPDLDTEFFPLISVHSTKRPRKLELYKPSLWSIEYLPLISISPKSPNRAQITLSKGHQEKYATCIDELSFGKAEYSCSSSVIDEISKRASIQEKESEIKWNQASEFEPESHDTFLSQNDPAKSSNVSPNDSRVLYHQKEKTLTIEQVKANYNKKIASLQQQLKLKEFYIQQEIENFHGTVQSLEHKNEKVNEAFNKASEDNKKLSTSLENLKDRLSQLRRINKSYVESYGELSDSSLIYDEQVDPEKVEELISTLEVKLKVIFEKEKEIENTMSQVRADEQINKESAEYLKRLYEEMRNVRKEICDEKEAFFEQKSALIELEKKCREKSHLLDVKEKELYKYKEELIERERIATEKILRLPFRNGRRGNTNFQSLLNSPSPR